MPKKVETELTHLQCVNAAPKDKEWSLADTGRLSLVIKPDGGKRWLYRFQLHGKESKLWLGYFPAVGLSDARGLRDEAAQQVKAGQDPRNTRKVEQVKQAANAASTFETLAREWHAKQQPRLSDAHAQRIISSLEIDVFPLLGNLPVMDITAPLVLLAVQKIEQRGAIETAQRVLQRIGSVMRYAMQTGRAQLDPTYKLAETLTTKKVEHRPSMPQKELPEYFRRLEAEPLHPLTRLTGWRETPA